MTTTNLVQMPDPESMTALVAGEVRAELARARLNVRGLVNLVGGSYSYWSRRVNGLTALDVEDLQSLGRVLGCSPGDFLPKVVDARKPSPEGPEVWAPSGSNRRPTD